MRVRPDWMYETVLTNLRPVNAGQSTVFEVAEALQEMIDFDSFEDAECAAEDILHQLVYERSAEQGDDKRFKLAGY
jgi:hypothetical protein